MTYVIAQANSVRQRMRNAAGLAEREREAGTNGQTRKWSFIERDA